MIVVIYLLLCFVVAIVGRHRPLGFLGYLLFSIALTPVTMLLVQLLTQERFLRHEAAVAMRASVCPKCHRASREAFRIRYCAHCGQPL